MSAHPIPAAALANHVAILGKTGSGKTSTAKLAIEQAVGDGFRVCILDPIKSDWWGLTSSADGKKPGLDFRILGGPRGHVPLHSSAGGVIGQLVGSGQLPLSIVDMADFEPGGLQRFFVDFATALNRSAKGVLYLVIEEAHEFAPKERAGIGAENLAIHWAKKLATAGRSKGIRLIVSTQRVQALHNAVLGSCETVITHRLTAPADQEPVLKWLKANADKETQEKVASSLSSLPTGTGWLCSGEAQIFERVAFPKFRTFDNTATPTGDSDEITVKTAAVDPGALEALIGEAMAVAKANDPKELKARIAALEKELAAKPTGAPSAVFLKEAQERAFAAGLAAGEERGTAIGARIGAKKTLAEVASDVRAVLDRMAEQLEIAEPAPVAARAPAPPAPPAPAVSGSGSAPVVVRPVSPSNLKPALQKILDALAWSENLARRPGVAVSKTVLAFHVGMSAGGGGFSNYLGSLRTSGLITYPQPGMVALTDEGRALASAPSMITNAEVQAAALAKVQPQLQRVMHLLIAAHPSAMTKEAIAAELGMAVGGGGFANYLGKLRTLQLLEYPQPGQARATDFLFPESL